MAWTVMQSGSLLPTKHVPVGADDLGEQHGILLPAEESDASLLRSRREGPSSCGETTKIDPNSTHLLDGPIRRVPGVCP